MLLEQAPRTVRRYRHFWFLTCHVHSHPVDGNLLVRGPTGTGKTRLRETAVEGAVRRPHTRRSKSTAPEFQHSHEIAKLIGTQLKETAEKQKRNRLRRKANVLKITVTDLPNEQRWCLEGRLAGPWAAELRLAWRNAHHEGDKRRCVVELSDVPFIDRSGEAVLTEIMSQGAEFIARDVYINQLLERLRSE